MRAAKLLVTSFQTFISVRKSQDFVAFTLFYSSRPLKMFLIKCLINLLERRRDSNQATDYIDN